MNQESQVQEERDVQAQERRRSEIEEELATLTEILALAKSEDTDTGSLDTEEIATRGGGLLNLPLHRGCESVITRMGGPSRSREQVLAAVGILAQIYALTWTLYRDTNLDVGRTKMDPPVRQLLRSTEDLLVQVGRVFRYSGDDWTLSLDRADMVETAADRVKLAIQETESIKREPQDSKTPLGVVR